MIAMCTAVTYHTRSHYFGRTLDLEHTFLEEVTVTPRRFPLPMRHLPSVKTHFAIIGMASVVEGYPLYYDACNEHGLAMAGLNFPDHAHYFPVQEGMENVASFELIPWLLGQSRDIHQAKEMLQKVSLCHTPFSQRLPSSPLHWLLADKTSSVTIECTQDGLHLYDNPVGVLTNNPSFPYHLTHLCDFMHLTRLPPENHLPGLTLSPYSRGMGAMGLPGDLSSASRFVRAAFVKLHSLSGPGEAESVSQFFHILGAVAQQRGCVQLSDGGLEITAYTSCINQELGIYYYTTYENQCISAVHLHRCDLEGHTLFTFPLQKQQRIFWQN